MAHLHVVYQGELEKRGGGTFSSQFRKRWFQLQCGRTEKRLVYFKESPKNKERGHIDLNNVVSVQINQPDKEILIITPDRTYVLRGKTLREVQIWSKWLMTDSYLAQTLSLRGLSAHDTSKDFINSIMKELEEDGWTGSDDEDSYTNSRTESGSMYNVSVVSLKSEPTDSELKFHRSHKRQASELHSEETHAIRLDELASITAATSILPVEEQNIYE